MRRFNTPSNDMEAYINSLHSPRSRRRSGSYKSITEPQPVLEALRSENAIVLAKLFGIFIAAIVVLEVGAYFIRL